MNFNLMYMGDLTRELATILRQEASLLQAFHIDAIKPLLARKQEIALEMEKQRNYLAAEPAILQSITETEKQYLRDIAADYDLAMVEYQDQLFKAQKVNYLVIQKLAEFVKEHVQQNRAYNKSGTQNLSGIELARNTPAIKFNEQI